MKPYLSYLFVCVGLTMVGCTWFNDPEPWPSDFLPKNAVAKVHGKLLNSQGQPVVGARFKVPAWPAPIEGVTDSRGEYVFNIKGEQTGTFVRSAHDYWSLVTFELTFPSVEPKPTVNFELSGKDIDFEIPDIKGWSPRAEQTELADGALEVRPFLNIPDIAGMKVSKSMGDFFLPNLVNSKEHPESLTLSKWVRQDFELFISPSVVWSDEQRTLKIRQTAQVALTRGSLVPISRGAECTAELRYVCEKDPLTFSTCPYTNGKMGGITGDDNGGSARVITVNLARPSVLSRIVLSNLRIAVNRDSADFLIETSSDGQSWQAVHTRKIPRPYSEYNSDDFVTGDGLVLAETTPVSFIRLRMEGGAPTPEHADTYFVRLGEISIFGD